MLEGYKDYLYGICEWLGFTEKENGMENNEYQVWTESTAIYPRDKALEYLVLGLSSEVGEVAGKVKKFIRDGIPADYKDQLNSELGDVLWYIARILAEEGITLSSCMEKNKEKLMARKAKGTLNGSGDHR